MTAEVTAKESCFLYDSSLGTWGRQSPWQHYFTQPHPFRLPPRTQHTPTLVRKQLGEVKTEQRWQLLLQSWRDKVLSFYVATGECRQEGILLFFKCFREGGEISRDWTFILSTVFPLRQNDVGLLLDLHQEVRSFIETDNGRDFQFFADAVASSGSYRLPCLLWLHPFIFCLLVWTRTHQV